MLMGPHDLSVSLGIPEQYDHPEFDKTVRKVIYVPNKLVNIVV